MKVFKYLQENFPGASIPGVAKWHNIPPAELYFHTSIPASRTLAGSGYLGIYRTGAMDTVETRHTPPHPG